MKNRGKVLLLTNFIPPYYLSVFERLKELVGDLRIFLSTPMEANRHWEIDWGSLQVRVQKSCSFTKQRQHPHGFTEASHLYIPYDTLPLLCRERPEVIISAQLGMRTLQAAAYRKLFPRSRLVIWTAMSSHTEKNLSPFRIWMRKRLLRCADAVTANGQNAAAYLSGLGVPHDRICRLPYAPDLSRFNALPVERDPSVAQRLMYFGQLVPRKGLVPFLVVLTKWLATHPEHRIEFWLVGDGPLRKELEAFPVPSSLKLRFFGNVAYDELPRLYAQGGILAFPTLADEWGVVVNEALASGMPVLGSLYSQAVEELVEDGVHGWTFHPDHAEEMYEAMDHALTTPAEKLGEMRRAGREKIRYLNSEFGAKCFRDAIDLACSLPGRRPPESPDVSADPEPTDKAEVSAP